MAVETQWELMGLVGSLFSIRQGQRRRGSSLSQIGGLRGVTSVNVARPTEGKTGTG